MRGGSAACSVVRCAFKLVTACNTALLLPSGGGGGDDDDNDGVSASCVFVSALSFRFRFSAFSAIGRLSALGVIPVMT